MNPPKPTVIRIREGNRGHRPMPEHEPKESLCRPEPPPNMSQAALSYWPRIVEDLFSLGVMTASRALAVADLCENQARLTQIRNEIASAKAKLTTKGPHGAQLNPLLKAEVEFRKLLWVQLREFGMTPSAATRVEPNDTRGFSAMDEALA